MYLAWVQPVPKIAQKDKSYRDLNDVLTADSNDEDRSYHDGHSNRTRSGRGDGFSLRPRTRGVAAGRDGDGSDNFNGGHDSCAEDRLHPSARKASKRKVLSLSESSNHNQSFLSEATLFNFNQQIGEAAWTDDRIHQWSKRSKRSKTKKEEA